MRLKQWHLPLLLSDFKAPADETLSERTFSCRLIDLLSKHFSLYWDYWEHREILTNSPRAFNSGLVAHLLLSGFSLIQRFIFSFNEEQLIKYCTEIIACGFVGVGKRRPSAKLFVFATFCFWRWMFEEKSLCYRFPLLLCSTGGIWWVTGNDCTLKSNTFSPWLEERPHRLHRLPVAVDSCSCRILCALDISHNSNMSYICVNAQMSVVERHLEICTLLSKGWGPLNV